MQKEDYSKVLDLKNVEITDAFWGREQELVRREVIPYQWEALNDRIPDAAPSYCMRNFRVAGRLMREKKEKGMAFTAPSYTYRGFEALPEDPKNPDPDRFYGFVFQDSDFAKWIEAVGYSLINKPDPELEHIADQAIDVVCAAQAENGYLDTYYIINGMDRIFTNLRDHHELYCFGHLAEGAISYYQATGKDKLLKATERYADFICSQFGPEEGKRKGYPGHEIAEMALTRLYELTGEKKYLDLSSFFLDMRGTRPYYFDLEEKERAEHEGRPYKAPGEEPRFMYQQAHMPVRQQSEAVGHAVRAGYLYSGMADVARLTGDQELFEACERLWNNITKEKLYITGGIGGTPAGEAFSFPYDLPNDTAYSETCAAISLAFFARRMLQIQADARYGDVMEQALYNTVLAGMALDGKSFFYVNPLEVIPEACRKDERKRHVQPVRQKWFGCACCPPNIARIVSSMGAYVYTQNDNTLYTHLYVGSKVNACLNGRCMKVEMESSFPWEGEVKAVIGGIAAEGMQSEISSGNGNAAAGGCSAARKEAENRFDVVEEAAAGDSSRGVEKIESIKEEVCHGTLAFRIPGWCWNARAEVRRRRKTESGEDVICTLCGYRMERKDTDGKMEITCMSEKMREDSGQRKDCEQRTNRERRESCGQRKDCKQEENRSDSWQDDCRAEMQIRLDKGYLYLTGDWQEGDEIFLHFPMEIRCVSANTEVRENIGKVAFTRGPICYCMEEADNGDHLWLLRADTQKLSEAYAESSRELGHEMRVLKIPGLRQEASVSGAELYGDFRLPAEKETTLTLIPYYAWNNRGEGEMSVWLRV